MNEESIKILLADDDESISTTLEFILLDQGFTVDVVNNGQSALDIVKEKFFNIAILDYRLPDIDGILLGKNIKEMCDDTEVIILTGQATLESAIKAVKENIYDYLTKPIDPDKLIEVIHSALEKQHLILENKRLFWELKTINKKLERINTFKDGIISMISHDLRSPISSIKGFNYSLLEGYVGELTKEQREIIETENTAIETMMDLINNILDMRQIEAGELQMNKIKTDLNKEVVEPVVKRLAPQLNEKSLKVDLNLASDAPAIDIDVMRISQVLQNLLQNAIKFTPSGGTIAIETALSNNNQFSLKIKDTGKGIPKESLNTIFEMFYTEDSYNKSRVKTGRGLGLAICKEIIRGHDGMIWADSEGPGQGSSFIILLPINESKNTGDNDNGKENISN